MTDNKNFLIAIALSLFVLLGWSWAAERYFPAAKEAPSKVEQQAPPAVPIAAPAATPAPPGQGASAKLAKRSTVLSSSPRVAIDTPSLKGSINLRGAQFDDLVLATQRQDVAPDSAPVRLLSPIGAPGSYIASIGWTANGAQSPGFDTLWTADSDRLSPGHPVTLTTQMPDGMRYRVKIAVDDGYLFTISQSALNGTGRLVSVRPVGLVSRAGQSSDPSAWTNHVGPIGVFDGKADYEVDWKTLDEAGANGQRYGNTQGWLGFTDKFWLTALAPAGNVRMDADFRRSPAGGYQAEYALSGATLAPGQQSNSQTRLFAGAKEKKWLTAYEDSGLTKLSKAIDWGWFEWFMRPIFALLLALFRVTGNFGVAIMGLTLIVRLIMFPIAQKQFASMAAMRKVQPKLKAIQERFKDDKPRQQQEILALYQKEKINPAAGCLPILIQIPVFYALYKVLMVSVEMRHQPFVWWIHDLSARDPLTPLNLFGLLDYTLPQFLHIGVLPILVGFTQWLTMKLNPQPMDPIQQQMFSIMPWMMIFLFAPFAAGLQLYWVTNNVLTIAQQWWLYRRFGLHFKDTHPVES